MSESIFDEFKRPPNPKGVWSDIIQPIPEGYLNASESKSSLHRQMELEVIVKSQRNMIYSVLHKALGRTPLHEDMEKCEKIPIPNDLSWGLLYNGELLGYIEHKFEIKNGAYVYVSSFYPFTKT